MVRGCSSAPTAQVRAEVRGESGSSDARAVSFGWLVSQLTLRGVARDHAFKLRRRSACSAFSRSASISFIVVIWLFSWVICAQSPLILASSDPPGSATRSSRSVELCDHCCEHLLARPPDWSVTASASFVGVERQQAFDRDLRGSAARGRAGADAESRRARHFARRARRSVRTCSGACSLEHAPRVRQSPNRVPVGEFARVLRVGGRLGGKLLLDRFDRRVVELDERLDLRFDGAHARAGRLHVDRHRARGGQPVEGQRDAGDRVR